MVTNYPIASRDGAAAVDHAHTDGLGVLDRMRQMLCGLHGHDTLLHFEQDRMSLRCAQQRERQLHEKQQQVAPQRQKR